MSYQGLKSAPAVPSGLQAALDRYVKEGAEVGPFLRAIICNDLSGAVLNSNDTNLATIPNVFWYLYGECPSDCWGSPEKYAGWLR